MRHYLSSHYSLMGRLTHVPPLAMVAEGGGRRRRRKHNGVLRVWHHLRPPRLPCGGRGGGGRRLKHAPTRDKSQQHSDNDRYKSIAVSSSAHGWKGGGRVRLIRHYDLTIRPTPELPVWKCVYYFEGPAGIRLCIVHTLPPAA